MSTEFFDFDRFDDAGHKLLIESLHAYRVDEVNLECLARADGGSPHLRTFQKKGCIHVGSWIEIWNWGIFTILDHVRLI